MTPRWQPAQVCSVIGAAHRRQGAPCQDASLSSRLTAANGEPVELMLVADGHGASNYWLSHVGSALACRCGAETVAAALQRTPLQAIEQWQQLLARELPQQILQAWLAAIAHDWQQRADARPFSPYTYGCTLGLVLMTPEWWGYSGLGDWDLVEVPPGEPAALVSQESELLAGEATASLCLPQAGSLFAARAGLRPLTLTTAAPRLLLCTDGVRKSCATDHDFLNLCTQVSELIGSDALQQVLEQITREGSGDDVSLAIGRPCHWSGDVSSQPERRKRLPWQLGAAVLGGSVLLASTAWLTSRWWRPPAAEVAAHRAEGERLCSLPPALLQASLNQRRPQFQRLLRERQLSAALLASGERDPLGAVIAASHQGQPAPCPQLQQALLQQWQQARQASGKMPPSAAPPPR